MVKTMNMLETLERRGRALRPSRRSVWPPRRLSLALQGGGSFGAFTWGVLDRLLEEEAIEFDTVSGASAGAFNAVILATALAEGDRQLAREKLEHFWLRTSQSLGLNPFGTAAWFNPGAAAGSISFWTSFLSPYQFNPLDLNPMRNVLSEVVDFESLRRPGALPLLLAATRVSDGQARIFNNAEIDAETVLASASLPLFYHAVKIDDEAYWDGGYSANPPLVDLAMASSTPDILVVQITPMRKVETPLTSPDIIRRLGHITFNASLLREMAALDHLAKSNSSPWALLTPMGRKFRRLRQHHIAAEEVFNDLHNASEMNVSWEFLLKLRALGREAAETWLSKGAADATAKPTQMSRFAALETAVRAQTKPLLAYAGDTWNRLGTVYGNRARPKDAGEKAMELSHHPAPSLPT
jgi:NTE family protein